MGVEFFNIPHLPVLPQGEISSGGGKLGVKKEDFFNMMKKAIEETNHYQQEADHAIKEVVAGRTKNLHQAMLALEKAEISLKFFIQVRNKLLESYQEMMRMQI